MAKWRVGYHTGAYATVEVEAEDQDEAWEKAEKEFESPQPCYYCSRHFDLGDWEPDESEYGTEMVGD